MKKALLVITVLAVSWVSGANAAGGQAVTPSPFKDTGVRQTVKPDPFLSRGVTPNPWKSFDVRQVVRPNPWKVVRAVPDPWKTI